LKKVRRRRGRLLVRASSSRTMVRTGRMPRHCLVVVTAMVGGGDEQTGRSVANLSRPGWYQDPPGHSPRAGGVTYAGAADCLTMLENSVIIPPQ
jgi:hypothetical protein